MTNQTGGSVQETDLTVRADPDKLFFIENLIKDIELIPAILDLVDNSVDSARRIALESAQPKTGGGDDLEASPIDLPEGSFAGLHVDLTIGPDSFEIRDNCGGISLDVARKYAFRFGRSRDFEGVPGSVGEFGVGMKRALFKLGRWFSVESRSDTEWFDLEVDVDEWVREGLENDWTFRFRAAESGLPRPSADERGTAIRVAKLHDSVKSDFQDDNAVGLLREQLRLRHQAALDLKLEMTLNGERLTGLTPVLMSGADFRPIRQTYLIEEGEGTLTVEIVAGIVDTDRREISRDEGQAENFRSTSEAGWWVFCNNRLLLVADKTAETGWGNGAASYHPQYRLFRGYVYMSSLDAALLPWNTTKTGVDADSRVWRRVQALMVSALVDVQALLNRLKRERESLPDDDESVGVEASVEAADAVYLRALERAAPVPVRQLTRTSSLVLPAIPKRSSPPRRRVWQRLQYDIPRDQFQAAMSKLKLGSAAELGRRSFAYFYKREVEEE